MVMARPFSLYLYRLLGGDAAEGADLVSVVNRLFGRFSWWHLQKTVSTLQQRWRFSPWGYLNRPYGGAVT